MRYYEQQERLTGNLIVPLAMLAVFLEWFLWGSISDPMVGEGPMPVETAVALRLVVVAGVTLVVWVLTYFRETAGQRLFAYVFVLGITLVNGMAPVLSPFKLMDIAFDMSAETHWAGRLAQEWNAFVGDGDRVSLVLCNLAALTAAILLVAVLIIVDVRIYRSLAKAQRAGEHGMAQEERNAAYRRAFYWRRVWARDVNNSTAFIAEFDPNVWVDLLRATVMNGHLEQALLCFWRGARWHRDSAVAPRALEVALQAATAIGGEKERRKLLAFVVRIFGDSLLGEEALTALNAADKGLR